MEITFASPQFLLFLLSVPLLIISHFFTMVSLKRRAFKFANLEAIKRVTGGEKASFRNTIFLSRNLGLLLMRIGVLLLLIFSSAGMTLWLDRLTSDYDLVLVIDASSSMLANDFPPTRLSAAKEAAENFVSKLSARTSIGVVSFSGQSYVEQSMSTDPYDAIEAIHAIEVRSVGGTDIGGALVTATNLLSTERADSSNARVIVLLTDGQSNVGTPVEEGVSYAQSRQVRVFTIGVATPEGGQFLRTDGVSVIDEKTLQDVAIATQGRYFRAESSEQLVTTFNEILASSNQRTPINLSQAMLMVALLLLFFEWGLISTKYRSVP